MFSLRLLGGSEVRLIGALSPRLLDAAVEAGVWTPERDTKNALERLVLGRSVELAFAGRRSDRYGRLLAHVFVGSGDTRVWVQGHLVREGRARAYALAENTACVEDLIEREARARQEAAGLWSHAGYRIRSAENRRELLRLRSTYQIVEGRVRRVTTVRGQTHVDFGDDWREDFTATVRSADTRLLERAGIELKSLEGRAVRVRGWIERRAGPSIEVRHPTQIEVPAETAAPARSDVPAAPPTDERERNPRGGRDSPRPSEAVPSGVTEL